MLNGYLKLFLAALVPIFASVGFYLLLKFTDFQKWNYWLRQLMMGIVFGAIAILGTEWGIPLNGAQLNCRDAAPLCAGLFFGGPAGILAGIIGGVERWLAVAWGAGTVTRLACTVSTILAGIFAAGLRKFMLDSKRPSWSLALAIGVVMEVFHLTMVFVTNMDDTATAEKIVMACLPMIGFTGLSVMLNAMALTLVSGESLHRKNKRRISDTIQRELLICVTAAFFLTSGFVYILQDGLQKTQSENLLLTAISDVESDITKASDENMLQKLRLVKAGMGFISIEDLKSGYNLSEIDVIDENGIITDSTEPAYIGFDMHSGEQSAEFLVLLDGETDVLIQPYQATAYDARNYMKYAGIALDDGFLQIAYDAPAFQEQLAQSISNMTEYRHVGQTGYILIADHDGTIISQPEDTSFETLADTGLDVDSISAYEEEFSADIGGVAYSCVADKAEGYTILALLPEAEAVQYRDVAVYVNAFMEVLIFAVIFGLIYLLIKHIVLNNLNSINHSLAEISNGNLDVVINVRANEEFASLSDDINTTVDTLKHYISEAAARIDKELEFAKNIQASALPSHFPAFPQRKEFDVYASMCPAKEVGGDFYDFYITNNNTMNFMISDVSGKGIPAAMFMMRAKTELKSLAESGLPIDEVYTRGNNDLCEGNDAEMFVTSWMGQLNLVTGVVSFANAGHNPPVVRHLDGKYEFLKNKVSLVLAGMEGIHYPKQEFMLEPGEIIFLYTDGVTEATNARNELYGDDRLLAALNACTSKDPKEICAFVKADVDAFVAEAPQFDDITMLALRYDGKPELSSIHKEHATIEDIPEITEFVEEKLTELGCPMKTVFQMNIAIDEIYSNIVKFAYGETSGPATVQLEETLEPRGVALYFVDEGVPYNPMKKEDPDTTLSAEEREIGGLGIFMVKKSMDDMSYTYQNNRNILRLFKKF